MDHLGLQSTQIEGEKMKIDEKLELILRAIRREIKIELNYSKLSENNWRSLTWLEKTRMFDMGSSSFSIDELLNQFFDIQEQAPKLPLLSQDECEFLKWFPQSWWIAKDDYCIFLYSEKPKKTFSHWFDGGDRYGLNMPTFPKFNGLTLLDEDCYTIGELIKYAQEKNK